MSDVRCGAILRTSGTVELVEFTDRTVRRLIWEAVGQLPVEQAKGAKDYSIFVGRFSFEEKMFNDIATHLLQSIRQSMGWVAGDAFVTGRCDNRDTGEFFINGLSDKQIQSLKRLDVGHDQIA